MSDSGDIDRCSLPTDAVRYLNDLLPNGFVVLYSMPPGDDGKSLVMMANFSRPDTVLRSVASAVDLMLKSHLG